METVKKRKALVYFTVTLLLSAVVWTAVRARSRYAMPVHNGKTAEEWFFGPTGHPGLETTIKAARPAFQAMGTNCVPFLLEKAKTRETAFNRSYCWLHSKLPWRMQAKAGPALRATYIQMIAYMHLRSLEQKAEFMADEILASVKLIEDDRTRWRAFESTKPLAERMGDLEKKKAYFLFFLNDSNFEIQLDSAVMLSRLDNKLTNGVPILAMAMTNTAFLATSIVSQWPTNAIPFLMPDLTNTIRARQKSAYEALRMVSPGMEEQLQRAE